MCARQEDANRGGPHQKQKRPLSIIEEDSDDSDAPDGTKKVQHTDGATRNGQLSESGGKENTPVLKRSVDNNKDNTDSKDVKTIPKSPEISLNSNIPTTVSKNKKASKGPPVSPKPKTKPDLTLKSSKSSPQKQKFKPSCPSPTSPPPDSKIPVLKSRTGRRSALAATDSDNKNSSHNEKCSSIVEENEKEDSNSLSPSAPETVETLYNHKNSSEPPNCPSTEASQSGSESPKDSTPPSSISSSRVGGDGQGLARIRETAERLNLTSPSSSMSSPPSFSSLTSSSPKFAHRLRMQTSTPRAYHDGKSPTWPSVPQITITPSSGETPLLVSLALSTSADADDITNNNCSSSPDDSLCSNNTLSPALANKLNSYLGSRRFSSYFTRRLSTDSNGSLSEGELSDGSSNALESPESTPSTYLSDFRKLQETTDKLRLSTRRPSTMLWRQKYMENTGSPRIRVNLNDDAPDERLTSDRKQRIDEALVWLRNELQEMRSQDQNLARQLLTIRHDIHQLKLRRSTEEHQDLIDDFQSELEEMQEFSDVLDLPHPVYGNNRLKQIGVTRLNLSARRFSAC